jgi:hypothetical protein
MNYLDRLRALQIRLLEAQVERAEAEAERAKHDAAAAKARAERHKLIRDGVKKHIESQGLPDVKFGGGGRS